MMHRPRVRVACLLLAAAPLVGCASAPRSGALSNAAGASSVVVATPAGLTPTPTVPPSVAVGQLTRALPAGITAVKVTLIDSSEPVDVVYGATVVQASKVHTLVAAIDELRAAGDKTPGCSMSPVNLRLDFTSPHIMSALVEDSSCRHAVLTIDGSPGPQLDSAELGVAEAVLGITVSIGSNGKPTAVSELAQEAVPESLRGACGHPGAQATLSAVPITIPRDQCDLTGVVVLHGPTGVTVPSEGGVGADLDAIGGGFDFSANVDPTTGDVTFS